MAKGDYLTKPRFGNPTNAMERIAADWLEANCGFEGAGVATSLANVIGEETAKWRDDALEKAAQIVLRYGADSNIASDIRAMKSAAPPPQVDSRREDDYLVWSNEHRAWWRANSAGYAIDVREAGHYTREEAISISVKARDGWGKPTDTPDELAIPISALPENIRLALRPERSGGRGA